MPMAALRVNSEAYARKSWTKSGPWSTTNSPTVRIRAGLSHCGLAISHKFFLRDVSWIHSS